MNQSILGIHTRRRSDAKGGRRARLRWWERCLACVAGAFTGAGTVVLWVERALDPAVARVREALAAGAPLDPESARTLAGLLALAERFEPLVRYPAWAVGAGVAVVFGALCALAARLIRGGGRTAWITVSLAVPLALAWVVWPSWA